MEKRLRVRDLLTSGQTGSNLIQYVRESPITKQAATARSRRKSKAQISDSAVVTIAHWLKASSAILADGERLIADTDAKIKAARKKWARRVKQGKVSKGAITELRRVGLLPRRRAAAV